MSVPESFDAGGALEHRLGQVAGLRRDGDDEAQQCPAKRMLAGRGQRSTAHTTIAASVPPTAPLQVLLGRDVVHKRPRG